MTPARRADAQRNRAQLLDAARRLLAAGGATTALEAIAREAGVGIGTLYRHFPTRESLIEAVYRSELGRLCASARELRDAMPAREALRAWMNRFADYVTTKRELADALRPVISTGAVTASSSRAQLATAASVLLDAGVAQGTLRSDVRADDLVASLVGIFLACGENHRDQADRMMDLLLDGLTAGIPTEPATHHTGTELT